MWARMAPVHLVADSGAGPLAPASRSGRPSV